MLKKISLPLLLSLALLTAGWLFLSRLARADVNNDQYLPLLSDGRPLPPLPPPVPLTSTLPLDVPALTTELAAQGQVLALGKIGFHVGIPGNLTGLEDWMVAMDNAGIPFFLKSVDYPDPLVTAQTLAQTSGISHTLVFRRSGLGYDLPDYNLPPATAAQLHWLHHKLAFPAQLDPSLVWLETINEVDKNRAEWLGEFALETAQLALADGYRWAAFGWSSGEPEPEHWESPAVIQFLQLAAEHPDQLAIAIHEYSYLRDDIANLYPYLVGRFQSLFQICDRYGIPRPTILITEWGWEYQDVPTPTDALADIAWASWLYAAYPEVRGAAIWYLGYGYGNIADQAQQLIAPLTEYNLHNYFSRTPGVGSVDPALFTP
ncbi:MAG: hypothetical protein KC418_09585 [Anaerolineales bacterium]|nr:hypothetical protein [Anaerolineales bacterium]MCB8953961.1 hypothetical protein [Ardenticatenales bacterium]